MIDELFLNANATDRTTVGGFFRAWRSCGIDHFGNAGGVVHGKNVRANLDTHSTADTFVLVKRNPHESEHLLSRKRLYNTALRTSNGSLFPYPKFGSALFYAVQTQKSLETVYRLDLRF